MFTEQQTIELLNKALQSPSDALARDLIIGRLNKSATQATGLVAFDLEAPARTLINVLTSIRNRIARVGGGTGLMANWKMITSVNSPRQGAGVSEGNRGAVINTTSVDKSVSYRGLGLENNYTFEAGYAAEGFMDIDAFESLSLLNQLFLAEEHMLLGGNTSMALGTTPTPSLSTATSGGSIAATTTVSVICVALTFAGWQRATLTNGIPQAITKTNADGSTDTYGGGSAAKSANATVTTGGGSTNTVSASVAAVPGAVAYAWFVGTAGAEKIAQITTVNSAKFTALPATGQTAASLDASDHSTSALAFDGLLTYASQASLGALYAAQGTGTPGTGTPLTSDGAGGIAEISADLRLFWDLYKIVPDRILANSQEQANITNKVVANGGVPVIRYPVSGGQGLTAGVVVDSITHPVTKRPVPIEVHPDMVPGTLMYEADTVPFQGAIGPVKRVKTRREYHRIDWPLRTRKNEWGVYVDEVLQVYYPQTLGVRTNIANG